MAKVDLAPHVGQLVIVEGQYDCSDCRKVGDWRWHKIAVVSNLWISGDFPNPIWVGHSHIQYAGAILDAKPKRGDKIRFLAEVYSYMARDRETNLKTIQTYGLSNPTDVNIYEAAPNIQTSAAQPTTTLIPCPIPPLPEPSRQSYGTKGKVKQVAAVREALGKLGPDATLEEVRKYVFDKYAFSPTSSTLSYAKRVLKNTRTESASPPSEPTLRLPSSVEGTTPTQSVPFGDAVELLNSVRSVGRDTIRTVLELEKRVGGAEKLQQIIELLK